MTTRRLRPAVANTATAEDETQSNATARTAGQVTIEPMSSSAIGATSAPIAAEISTPKSTGGTGSSRRARRSSQTANPAAPSELRTPIGAATSSFSGAPRPVRGNDHDCHRQRGKRGDGADHAEEGDRRRARTTGERARSGAQHARPDPRDELEQGDDEPGAGQ